MQTLLNVWNEKREKENARLERKIQALEIQIESQERNLKSGAEALQGARERIATLEDVIVPGLVSGHEVMHRCFDAQTATFARQQAMNQHGVGGPRE